MDSQTTTASPSKKRWQSGLAVVVLLLSTVIVYGRVCRHEFAGWDDPATIHHNPLFDPPTREKIAHTWVEPFKGLYTPVTQSYLGTLAFLAETKDIDREGIHLDARVFHTGSLVLHVLSVLLVFAILNLLSGHVGAALGGGLLFALHPLQVESVAWASGAKDMLCGLLSLCAVYQYLLFARREGDRRRWGHYAIGAVAMLLAMLSKPSAMVVPAVVVALDLFVIGRPWRRVAVAAGGWCLVVAPLAIVARLVQNADIVPDVAVWRRPFVAADALTFYLWKLIWPVTLCLDYARRPAVALRIWGGVWPVVSVLIVAGLGYWAWRGRGRRPWVVAAMAVFVAGVAPMLGLTPFMYQYTSTVADHYVYLSMLGPAMVGTWLLTRYGRPAVAWGVAIVAVLLGVRSNLQLAYWHDDHAAWAHAAAVSPDSFVAPSNLGTSLAREAAILNDRADEAREAGRAAEADALLVRRRALIARAADLQDRAIAINPDFVNAYRQGFNFRLRLGQERRAAELLEKLLAVNDAKPASVRTDFTSYRETAGILWAKLGEYQKAATQFEKYVSAVPANADARQALAEVRAKLAEARTGDDEVLRR